MNLEDFVVTELPELIADESQNSPRMELGIAVGWVIFSALLLFVIMGGVAMVVR